MANPQQRLRLASQKVKTKARKTSVMNPKVGVAMSMQAAKVKQDHNGEVSSGCRGMGGTGNLGKN